MKKLMYIVLALIFLFAIGGSNVAVTEDCGSYGPALCTSIESYCCGTSPSDPNAQYCATNWNESTCGECYHNCSN